MKIYITMPAGVIRDSFITPNARRAIEKSGEVSCNPYDRQLTREELKNVMKDADVLITGWGTEMLTADLFLSADKLKIVAHTGGSVGNLVDGAVYEKGIRVLSGNNVYAKSVAEGCLCYTISALRQTEIYINVMRNGGWKDDSSKNRGLIGKRVGLVGFGAIAKYFVEMLRLFHTEVLVYSSYLTNEEAENCGVELSAIDTIFETCDVISLHSGLTEKTTGMINKELLKKIKDGALLVNTARGALMDETALIEELKTGRFMAALDVYTEEPLAIDSPLRTMQNVLPMPHMGGPTIDMREEVALTLAEDIKRFINGQPLINEIEAEHSLRMTKH